MSTSAILTAASMRNQVRSRYRQWLTHKLASWIDQFDTSGLRRLRPLHYLVPGGDRSDRRSGRDSSDEP